MVIRVRVPGLPRVFRYNGTHWVREAKFLASDGEADNYFGKRVAISGNTIAVRTEGVDASQSFEQGAVYIFRYSVGVWQ